MVPFSRRSLGCAAWLLAGAAHAATATPQPITFQGTPYTVVADTLPALPNGVSLNDNNVMIVVNPVSGAASLVIPTDGSVRTTYDPVTQHYYKVVPGASSTSNPPGVIQGFTALNAVQISLNLATGALGSTYTVTTQSSVVETYTLPADIPAPANGAIAVENSTTMIYRDGETAFYEIDRAQNALVQNSVSIANLITQGVVSVAYDPNTDDVLTVQQGAVDSNGNSILDTLGAYDRSSGTEEDFITLPSNPAFPNYGGGASGLALEPATETIVLLDSVSGQVYVFLSNAPTLFSASPGSGTYLGGQTVTLAGANLPSDAQVEFGGVAASITKQSATQIVVVTPAASAPGAVDITVTGTGISADNPLTLPGGYTYIDPPPAVALKANRTFGPPPLVVVFDFSGTADTGSQIANITMDFGDGIVDDHIPVNLSETTLTHTYIKPQTYTATLTVTDALGVSGSQSVDVTASNGVVETLVLRSLAMTIQSSSAAKHGDSLALTGILTLPDGDTLDLLAGVSVTATVGSANIALSGQLDTNGRLKTKQDRFAMRVVHTRGFSPPAFDNLYAFTLTHSGDATTLNGALPADEEPAGNYERGSIPVVLNFADSGTNILIYDKLLNPAVVLVKTSAKMVTTVRRE